MNRDVVPTAKEAALSNPLATVRTGYRFGN